jgi:osmotically inducible protein OsmC
MTVNTAKAEWQGDLPSGKGSFELGQGGFKGSFSFKSRFEGEKGTNPEELIAAAHASCFSMAFSNELAQAGFPVKSLRTTASVTLGKNDTGFAITKIELNTDADVPGVSEAKFTELSEKAKKGCPVSKALAGVPDITLNAKLQKAAA